MNTKLFAFVATIALYSGAAFCNPQEDLAYIESQLKNIHSEFDMNEKSNPDALQLEILRNNISLLESYILKALNRCEMKLARYQNRLKADLENINLEECSDCQYRNSRLDKKIETTQNKIKAIKEVHFGIQVLKLRLSL